MKTKTLKKKGEPCKLPRTKVRGFRMNYAT